HDQATGRLFLGIQSQLCDQSGNDLDVTLRLFQILFPLLPQVVVHDTLEGSLVDLDSAQLGFERLECELLDLLVLHETPPRDECPPIPYLRTITIPPIAAL